MSFNIQSIQGDRWSPGDHVGKLHIFSSAGESREMPDQYADEPGAVKMVPEMVFCMVLDKEGPLVVEAPLVFSTVLGPILRKPGIYLGKLTKRGQAYILEEPTAQEGNKLMAWLEDNCLPHEDHAILKDGVASSSASSAGSSAVEEEAPF